MKNAFVQVVLLYKQCLVVSLVGASEFKNRRDARAIFFVESLESKATRAIFDDFLAGIEHLQKTQIACE